jgi:hypothetical protein
MRRVRIKFLREPFPKLRPISRSHQVKKIRAHFLPQGQKTGLSAPIFFAAAPQKRISAAIPCAPRGFPDVEQVPRLYPTLTITLGSICLIAEQLFALAVTTSSSFTNFKSSKGAEAFRLTRDIPALRHRPLLSFTIRAFRFLSVRS